MVPPFSSLDFLLLFCLALSYHYHKVHQQRLQRLHHATPECVAMILSGSLPATGVLDLRMLSLHGMIARLGPENILHKNGHHILLNRDSMNTSKSWFSQIRTVCRNYGLPDPLLVLQSPPSHHHWKTLTKLKVLDWWQTKYRGIAEHMSTLIYFKSAYMSLSSLHSIWTTAGSPFEVGKAVVSARMLSVGYRTDKLMSHWNKSNPSGICRLPGCENEIGTLSHILLHCPGLIEARRKVTSNQGGILSGSVAAPLTKIFRN